MAGRRNTVWTPKIAGIVVEAIRNGASMAQAAQAAGVSRQTIHKYRQLDEDFALAVADAIEEGTDRLVDEARRRAFAGSDTLLIFLIKARRPEYRDSYRVEHSGRIDQRVTRADEALRRAVAEDPELAARIEELAARIEPGEQLAEG